MEAADQMSVVLMSKRELNRIDILARLESGRLTPAAAAELLRVSERQVYRLQRRFFHTVTNGASSFWPISRIRLSFTQLDALNKEGCQQGV